MYVPKAKKLPSGTWFIRMRLGGESVYVAASTERDARRKAELIKAEYRNEIRREKMELANDLTLEKAIDQYIARRQKVLSPSTVAGYRVIQRNRFKEIMKKPLRSVKDWQRVVSDETALVAPKTVHNAWMFVASVLRDAKLPVPSVALPQLVQDEHPWLFPEQIPKFIAALPNDDTYIPILLGLHGLRRSEIIGLDWKNVDLKNGTIRVAGSSVYDEHNNLVDKPTNKNTTSRRTVPMMIPHLRQALEKVPTQKRDGKVCLARPFAIYDTANRVCESLGFPKIGTHGLRHTFASLALSDDVGMTEREVMLLGGWKDAKTVHKIYEHVSNAQFLRKQNKMSAFYAKKENAT